MHGTLVLVVGTDVVVVVEVLDVVVLVDVLTDVVDDVVVEDASFGGPEWQWFLSPLPKPRRHGTDVEELSVPARE